MKIDDLLNDTFDNGSININFLEQIIRYIVGKIDLQYDDVPCIETKYTTIQDPVAKLAANVSKNDSSHMIDMINMLNITKRVEALEISVQKLSSIIHKILNNNHNNLDVSHESEGSEQNVEVKDESLEPEEKIESVEIFNRVKSGSSSASSNYHELIQNLNERTHIIEQQMNCLNSSVNKKQKMMINKICDIEDKTKHAEEKFKDLFYSCEQNDEKIDDVIQIFEDFKARTFCIKSDVNKLMEESTRVNENIDFLTAACEDLKVKKADLSYVEEVLLAELQSISIKLKDIYELKEIFHDEKLKYEKEMNKFSESMLKFRDDMRTILHFLKSQIDEKLDKGELKNLKAKIAKQFDIFVIELKKILEENFKNDKAKGTTEHLKCISCDNYCMMDREIHASIKVPEKRPKTLKPFISKHEIIKDENDIYRCLEKEPLLNFPSTSQHCFIITKDNSIFKADPMKCLLSANYTVSK